MRKIVVTGGLGFIGTNLVHELHKNQENDIIVIDNYIGRDREDRKIDDITYLGDDIRDYPQWLWHIKEADFIFHLAAQARIQPSLKDPVETYDINAKGTSLVLEAARKKGAKVVYAGSSSCHDGLMGSPYALSKFHGEELCRLYAKLGWADTTIFRFYNVYGKWQPEEGDNAIVLGIFVKQNREGKPLTLTGDGEQRRDFTHVDDIVAGLLATMDHSTPGETFELGTGKNYSMNEVADLFGGEKTYITARKGEYPTTLCTDTKAEEILGWKAKIHLKDYIINIKAKNADNA